MKKKGFIFGAVIVALGGFLSKLIGAFYRIPLTNLLGGEGIGLYQLIFPVYCILLDFSSVGVPTALSKLIAERRARGEEEEGTHLLQASFRLLLLLGVTGSIAIFWRTRRGIRSPRRPTARSPRPSSSSRRSPVSGGIFRENRACSRPRPRR